MCSRVALAVDVSSSLLHTAKLATILCTLAPLTQLSDAQLYRDVQLFPGSSTQQHLFTQHGLRVNGPLYSNPAEGPACLLVATKASGQPAIVKMLSNVTGEQQPGGTEAAACR